MKIMLKSMFMALAMTIYMPLLAEGIIQTSMDLEKQLIDTSSTSPFLYAACKNVVSVFVRNENLITLFDEQTVQRFMIHFARRWTDGSYFSACLWFSINNNYFFKTENERKIVEKVQSCIENWVARYNAFDKALHGMDLALVRDGLAAGMPYEAAVYNFFQPYVGSQEGKRREQFLRDVGISKTLLESMEKISIFNMAIFNDNYEVVEQALKNGFDPNKRVVYAAHALAFAVFHGKNDMINKLIAAGTQINDKVDSMGRTVLMIATDRFSRAINNETIPLLVSLGADVNAVDNEGRTALMYAWRVDNFSAFRLLLDVGANVYVKNNEGLNILEILHVYSQKYAKNGDYSSYSELLKSYR